MSDVSFLKQDLQNSIDRTKQLQDDVFRLAADLERSRSNPDLADLITSQTTNLERARQRVQQQQQSTARLEAELVRAQAAEDAKKAEAQRQVAASEEEKNKTKNKEDTAKDRTGQENAPLKKPDGTAVSGSESKPNLPQGQAVRNTGASDPGATVNPNKTNSVRVDPNKTSNILTFGVTSPGGPPYENVLEQFASYTPVWTLACLSPDQFNNPKSYRGKPGALRNIVFSSAGRFDAQRVRTAYGTPEYFVDNVVINTMLSPTKATGYTNFVGFEFDVYEPYSLGLFIQSLQSAAIYAGYPSYLDKTPFLLKLEFLGFKDNGAIFTATETLAKYFTVYINKVEFTCNEGGSNYKVQAAPAHHTGLEDGNNKLPVDLSISGENVKEMLVSGERSLCTQLNRMQQQLVKDGQRQYPDIVAVVFPNDHSDPVGIVNEDQYVEQLRATSNPNKEVKQPLTGRNGQETEDYGAGAIGKADMGFGPTSGGNYLHTLPGETVDESGVIVRDQMRIDPKQRLFMFKQEDRITEIIQRVVIASEYGVKAVKPENQTDGRVKWFRIDIQMQLLEYDAIRNTRARKIIYRVVPYLVSGHIFKNPTSVTAGVENLKKITAKRYNYLYTGQNNDLIKFDIKFDGMFYTGQMPRPLTKNANVSNKDVQNTAPENTPRAEVNQGAAGTAAVISNGTPTSSVRPDPDISVTSFSGDKTVEQMIADAFSKAFLEASKDLVNIDFDILGDPFYLSDSGLTANYFAEVGPNDQINADGSMNWEGGQIFCEINFRNPLEPNLGVTGQGGLWNFPDGGAASPFSGLYQVNEVINKFNGGVYQQTLKAIRVQNQPQDQQNPAPISKQEQKLYDIDKVEPEKTSPVTDGATNTFDPSGQYGFSA